MSKIGIIGGSGFYSLIGLKNVKPLKVNTPFGKPSDNYLMGKFGSEEVVFLARHGKGHTKLPSDVNYRANIYGMKKLGVDRIISVAACGSLKRSIRPGSLVIPDQYIDLSRRRSTFFGEGLVAHVSFAFPTCAELSNVLYKAGQSAGIKIKFGGTYINMEGPAFSTYAESKVYQSWGADIIGMTNATEAKLAREAGICYATIAGVTDYDAWHVAPVSIAMILQNMTSCSKSTGELLQRALPMLKGGARCGCRDSLKDAIVTDLKKLSAKTRSKMQLLIGRYL